MSQDKKLELSKRVREFRLRAKWSQQELAERLGVSGNYISMIELGKKEPGPSLLKLFEGFERSPLYEGELKDTGGAQQIPADTISSMLSTETLIRNFAEIAEKLSQTGPPGRKNIVGRLREMLDEIEHRLMAGSGPLSEAQQIAVAAAKSGAKNGKK